ncbi:MAG: hypothetical protein RL708_2669 [Bacteroidota bacterium]|jgi:hypothetical protein
MKKYLFIMTLISTISCTEAQTNLYWKLGYHTGIDFTSGTCVANLVDTCKMQMFNSNTSVCDNKGGIIFYSNSLFVKNKLDENMPNGINFNHGTISNSYIATGATPTFSGAIVVPFPNDTNKFYMFYTNMEYTIKGGYYPDRLRYLVVDKSLNGGLGDVSIKDVDVIIDTLMDGQIHAIKHGNGNDYWLIVRKYSSNNFYKILIDSSGVSVKDTQAIGNAYILGANAGIFCGQSNVSKQGDKLVYLYQAVASSGATPDGQMDIVNFDRCTGMLTGINSVILPVNGPDTIDVFFSCFSPNGNYVYANDLFNSYQFDLTDIPNLMANKVKVAHRLITSWSFGQMQIGVDDKIYCAGYGAAQDMHVINNPDILGMGCNFVQNQISFGGGSHYSNGGLPNVPNFALGAIAPCGNVGVAEVKQEELKIKNLYGVGEVLQIPINHIQIKLYNTLGQQLYENINYSNTFALHEKGLFIYTIYNTATNQWHSGKLEVQ